jgi:hypothetical protein
VTIFSRRCWSPRAVHLIRLGDPLAWRLERHAEQFPALQSAPCGNNTSTGKEGLIS